MLMRIDPFNLLLHDPVCRVWVSTTDGQELRSNPPLPLICRSGMSFSLVLPAPFAFFATGRSRR